MTDLEIYDTAVKNLCVQEHLYFTRYFFKQRQGSKFIVNWHHKLISDAIEKVIKGSIKNLIIEVSPGASKTELVVINLIARGLAINPWSRFLHLSYSDDLALLNSQTARDLVRSEAYQKFWPLQISPDTKSKKRWNVLVDNKIAGGVYATSLTGQITGFRAGHMSDGFNGAIICFPFDELVLTEKGPLKIGEIVNKKESVKVFSYNEITKQIELQNITKHHANGNSDIIKVLFNDGSTITCTPNHKIYTLNKGWVEAQNLKSTDIIPNFISCVSLMTRFVRQSDILVNFFRRFSRIKNVIPKLFRTSVSMMISQKGRTKIFSHSLPNFPIFNRINIFSSDIIFSTKKFHRFFRNKDIFNDKRAKFRPARLVPMMIFVQPNAIFNIIFSGSVAKIIEFIVSFVAVNVSNLNAFVLRTYKGLSNNLVNKHIFAKPIFTSPKMTIFRILFLFTKTYRNISALNFSKCFFVFNKNQSIKRPYSSMIRNFINTFIPFNRFPINISYHSHALTTYCLSIEKNHNFFIYQGPQALLVSNCDDPIKPEDALSKTKSESANRRLITTVKSRKARPETPMIFIMQRLSANDPSGFIKSGGLPGSWDVITIPALMDEKTMMNYEWKYRKEMNRETIDVNGRFSYWEKKEPLKDLLEMESGQGKDVVGNRVSRQVFSAQYQQHPVQMGGNIIKGSYFFLYDITPKILYRNIYVDTAEKTKEHNDFSVFECWGMAQDGKIYLLDLIRGKWEAPELIRRARAFWIKHATLDIDVFGHLRKMRVEDKSSGTGLIQTIKLGDQNNPQIPVDGIQRTKDKFTRVVDVLAYIEAQLVCLPINAHFTNDFIQECEAFTADDTHEHDDQVDPMIDAIVDMLAHGNKTKVWENLAD